MFLFSSELVVVVVELFDYSINVEGIVYGVELIGCVGNFGVVGYDGFWDDRVEEFGVFFELEIF